MQAVLECAKVQVVHPQGCLNAINALELERDLTTTLTRDEVSGLLLDLAKVESIDSAGLMALVSSLKVAQTLGKSFQLYSVSPAIKIIFELTQLDDIFEIFVDKPELILT